MQHKICDIHERKKGDIYMSTQQETTQLEMKKRNRVSIVAYFVISLVLLIAYTLEVVKGNRTAGYFGVFSILVK